MKKKGAIENKDYVLDPLTRRSTFTQNNKAAIVHGGYSVNIPEPILGAVLSNDLGFELGILKGQLCNLITIGNKVIANLIAEDKDAKALSIELACVDRSVKLIPQIQKLLESQITNSAVDNQKLNRLRIKWLKHLNKGNCSASELAYQFEINQLGELPKYVQQLVSQELSMRQLDMEQESLSREQIFEKIQDYRRAINNEQEQIKQRSFAVAIEKQKINHQLFAK